MNCMLGSVVLACALLVGACAGDRHLGPRAGEAFDGIFAQQAAPKFDPNSHPLAMTGEEADQALANVRIMSQRSSNLGSAPPLMPVSR